MSRPKATVATSLLAACLLVTGCNKDMKERIGGPSGHLSVSSITPATGSALGATRVTIVGAGFAQGAQVSLGGPAQAAVVVSSTTILFDTQPHQEGAVDVTVTNPDGASQRLAGGYTYVPALPPPAVTRITPSKGTTLGGTWVEITGTDIRTGATLTVDNVAVAAFFYEGSLYVSSLPAHSPGAVTVSVRNADGQLSSLVDGFSYVDPATLDFNGDWNGGTGYDWQTPVRISIRDNVVVSATCAGESVLPEGQAPVVIAGAFTIMNDGAQVMTGRILSDRTATGRIISPRCGADAWIADKAGTESLGAYRRTK